MNPVDWFEIPVTDLDRAKKFYQEVFKLQFSMNRLGLSEMALFPMKEAYGAAGSLIKGEGYIPSHTGTLVYFGVSDLESTLERIRGNGGRFYFRKHQ